MSMAVAAPHRALIAEAQLLSSSLKRILLRGTYIVGLEMRNWSSDEAEGM